MSGKLDQLAGAPAESKSNHEPDPRQNRSIRKPLDVGRRLDFDHGFEPLESSSPNGSYGVGVSV